MIVRGGLPADNYTITSNSAIEDKTISLKARMILVYLLSRPPGWVTSAERLASTISDKDGLSAIKSGLRELEQAGYLTRSRTRTDEGRWRWDHTITDRPSVENRPVVDASPQVSEPTTSRKPQESVVVPTVENMRSTIGGKSTGGSSTDGQPTDISKTDLNKTEISSSSSLRSEDSSGETAIQIPPPGERGPAGLTLAQQKEAQRLLAVWPGPEYLSIAASRWKWLSAERGWDLTQKYLADVKAKGWNYSPDGWLKFMENEDRERERRTRGRAYAPNGVPL